MGRRSILYRATLLLLVLGFLGAAAYFTYRYINRPGSETFAKQAEQSYKDGEQSLKAKEGDKAKESLAAAKIETDKALDATKEELAKSGSPDRDKKLREQQGKLTWLKAQILRDQAYADALADGKEIPEAEDSVTGEKFRFTGAIPEPSTRLEAVKLVMAAARAMPKDEAVQREALRLATIEPYDWSAIQSLATNMIDNVDRDDGRALYFLAKYNFEQPDSNGKATDPKKRAREQVEKAREYLQRITGKPGQDGDQAPKRYYPFWRTLNLEVEINNWLARMSPKASRDSAAEDMKHLRKVLFDPKNGALVRAARQENFKSLNKADIDGIVLLHTQALETAIDDARTGDRDHLFLTLKCWTDLTENLLKSEYAKLYRGKLLEAIMKAAMDARQVLGANTGDSSAAQWDAVIARLEQVAAGAVAAHVNQPSAYADLARLLNQEAFIAGKNNNTAKKQELEKRALKWIDEGIKLVDDATPTAAGAAESTDSIAGKIELLSAAVEVRLDRKDSAGSAQPFLDQLKKISDPRASALVGIHESASLVRQGKLAKAKKKLEAIWHDNRARDLQPLALILLTHVYLSTDMPAEAAAALNELEKHYARLDAISPTEREWFIEFLCDPEQLAFLSVVAQLETALKKTTVVTAGLTKDEMLESLLAHEESALQALKKLAVGKDANRRARLAFADYYLRTARADKAAATVDELKKDYPDDVDVLRMEVIIASLPDASEKQPDAAKAKTRQNKADNLIKNHLVRHPTDQAAKRYWVEWLIRTGRSKDALDYLSDAQNFPAGQDDQTKRLAGLVMLEHGKNEQAVGLLQPLAKDEYLDLTLIQATANPLERQRKLDEAIGKYENSGLLRLVQADVLMADNKMEEAAKTYWKIFEFSRVEQAARAGFLKAMLALAAAEPEKAAKLIDAFAAESPDVPALYSTAAYVAVMRDDFGSPQDVWARSRSMHAALNHWQDLARRNNLDASAIALFRAKLWLLATRSDLAWEELWRYSTQRNQEVLTQLIEMALDPNFTDDDKIDKALSFVGYLKEIKADPVSTALYEARLLDRAGRPAQAESVLRDLYTKNPNQFNVYPDLIWMLCAHGKEQKAAELVAYWRSRQPDNFIPALEEIRQDLAAGRIDTATIKSERFLADKVKEAEENFAGGGADDEKARQQNRREVRAAVGRALGQTWQKGGQPQGADKWIALWREEQPQDSDALFLQAQTAMDRQDWSKARQSYEAILIADPNSSVAQVNLAWLLAEHLGKPDEALKIVRGKLVGPFSGKKLAVERLPDEFLNVLGVVYAQAIRQKNDKDLAGEMAKIFEAASKRYPSDPRMVYFLGFAQAQLAEKDMAGENYRNALRLAEAGKGGLSSLERKELIERITESMKGI